MKAKKIKPVSKIVIRPGENWFRITKRGKVIGPFATECELEAAVKEYERDRRKKQRRHRRKE